MLRKHLDSVSEPRPTVHVSGVSSPTLETLLHFLHSGSITIKDESEAREFISAAAFFGVKGVEEGTEQTQVGKDSSRSERSKRVKRSKSRHCCRKKSFEHPQSRIWNRAFVPVDAGS